MKKALLLLLTFYILAIGEVNAGAVQGADLSYGFVSYDTVTGDMKYKVNVSLYRDCSDSTAPFHIPLTVSNAACGGSYSTVYNLSQVYGLPCAGGGVSGATGCDISLICPSDSSSGTCHSPSGIFPGVQKYVYSDTITLPGSVAAHFCSGWLISVTLSSRNASANLMNAPAYPLYVEALINNSLDTVTGSPLINNSVAFMNDPVPVAYDTSPVYHSDAGIEPDRDSLVYQITPPLSAHGVSIPFAMGYSTSAPVMSSPSFYFDPVTGQANFTPTQPGVDDLVLSVSEYRHGVLVGSTMRDMQLDILPFGPYYDNLPLFKRPFIVLGGVWSDSSTIVVCPGDSLLLKDTVVGWLSEPFAISSSVQSYPAIYPGMNFVASADWQLGWQNPDSGCRYIFVNAILWENCPMQNMSAYSFRICVGGTPYIQASAATYCGQAVLLTGSGGSSPVWSPASGLSAPGSYTTYASPSGPTTYYYSSTCGTDSIAIGYETPIPHIITHDTAICYGTSLQLQDSVAGAGNYAFRWTPSAGLYDPANPGSNGALLPDPLFSGAASQLYSCQVTDSLGCTIVDTVRLTVRGAVTLSVSGDTSIPAGTATILWAQATQIYDLCDTASIPIPVTGPAYVQVGTGPYVQGGSGFIYPSPLGNFSASARHQMLFKASELSAIFGSSHIITSIGLDIGILNSGSDLNDLTISIGCVRLDSLTAYVPLSNLYEVVDPVIYSPVAGWNILDFDRAYIWDGVSDLIVDICFTGNTYDNINNKMVYTNTSYRSYYWTNSDDSSMCGVTGTQSTPVTYADYFNRPNVRFGLLSTSPQTTVPVIWQPSTGPNAVINDAANPATAYPVTDQWYTVAADSICGIWDSIFVRVDTLPPGNSNQDYVLCSPDSVLLAAYNGATYTWSDHTGILSTDSAFYYYAQHSDTIYLRTLSTLGVQSFDTTYITLVSLSISVSDTLVCPGDTITLSTSGGSLYLWVDSSAILSTDSFVHIASSVPVSVAFIGLISGCMETDTIYIGALGQTVWPGDVNGDHVVDNTDYLYLGVAYGTAGPLRPGASIVWTGQCAYSWDSTFASGGNYASADANGDGVVNDDDTLAVYTNWGDTHAALSAPGTTPYGIQVRTDHTQYTNGGVIHVTVSVGDSSTAVQHLYGIGYQVQVSGTATISGVSQSQSYLAPPLEVFKAGAPALMYFAQCRINHTDTTAYGVISSMDIVLDSTVLQPDSIYITASNVVAIDKLGDPIAINPGSAVVAVSPLGIEEISSAEHISVYPNPTTGIVRVILGTGGSNVKLTVSDAMGRNVYEQFLTAQSSSLDLSFLEDGIYAFSFSSALCYQSKRIVITR